jgi:tripartite-type tricarboxylate transporter receptor subunit TctC
MVIRNKSVFVLTAIFISAVILTGGCSRGEKQSIAPNKYPTKPITIIVPFAAGGSMDMLARSLEKTAPKYLGQPLVVANVAGGAGTIGMNELAGSKPDGYTIGTVSMGVILQPLYGQTRYHYPTSLEPLVNVASSSVVVAVLADKPWKDLKDLASYAKSIPVKLRLDIRGWAHRYILWKKRLPEKPVLLLSKCPSGGIQKQLQHYWAGMCSL